MSEGGGSFVRHIECHACGSSDANALYDTGDTYCFSCHKLVKGGKIVSNGGDIFEDTTIKKVFNPVEVMHMEKNVRGISLDTFKRYGYGRGENDCHIINHYNKKNELIAQKMRYKAKEFSWKGNAKSAVPFGLNLFRSGGKRITITEGEIDCLSVAEALKCQWPVISINNGAQSAVKDLKEHIDVLNTYDEIVLWFDNDEPGHKAAKEVAGLFPLGKVSIINCAPYKDANEVLKDKGKAGIMQYYYEAKKYRPDGIVSGASLDFDEIINLDSTRGYSMPYPQLNRKLRGLRKGELITFTAGTGMGKTTAVREIAFDLLKNQGLKIGWVALEENNKRSALGFMSLYLDKPIYMTEEREQMPTELLKEAFDAIINTDNLYFFDHFGSLDSNNLITKLRYLAVAAQVDFIFLDHISIVVSGGVEDNNERIVIDNLMTALRSLAEETGVGIGIISHLKRPSSDKGFENGAEVTLSHLRGSGGIAQLSDAVVALERNQQDKEDNTVGRIRILKNRYTGETGLAGNVKYYTETGRLLNYDLEDQDANNNPFNNSAEHDDDF